MSVVMFVCPLILCSIVVSLSSDLHIRESTIAAMSGLLWWYVVCEGLCSSCCMACILVLESRIMHNHGSCLCIYKATWIAAKSALIFVCASS